MSDHEPYMPVDRRELDANEKPTGAPVAGANVVFGNPDRLSELSKQLYNNHLTLTNQVKELDACHEGMRALDKAQNVDLPLHPKDADLAGLIQEGRPPAFTMAGTLENIEKTVADTAFANGSHAYGTGMFAGDLRKADAYYRDVMKFVPALDGVLFGATGTGMGGEVKIDFDTQHANTGFTAMTEWSAANQARYDAIRETTSFKIADDGDGTLADDSYDATLDRRIDGMPSSIEASAALAGAMAVVSTVPTIARPDACNNGGKGPGGGEACPADDDNDDDDGGWSWIPSPIPGLPMPIPVPFGTLGDIASGLGGFIGDHPGAAIGFGVAGLPGAAIGHAIDTGVAGDIASGVGNFVGDHPAASAGAVIGGTRLGLPGAVLGAGIGHTIDTGVAGDVVNQIGDAATGVAVSGAFAGANAMNQVGDAATGVAINGALAGANAMNQVGAAASDAAGFVADHPNAVAGGFLGGIAAGPAGAAVGAGAGHIVDEGGVTVSVTVGDPEN